MFRFLARVIGLILVAAGFVGLVIDGTKSIADQRLYITRVSEFWAAVHETSLAQLRPTVERLVPWLWDPLVQSVLNAPTWLVLAVLGTVLILLGRKKRPLIGYAR